jgi:hypothetical protein
MTISDFSWFVAEYATYIAMFLLAVLGGAWAVSKIVKTIKGFGK